MIIYLNDQSLLLEASCTLQDILLKNECFAEHMAVAINNQFIPRPMFSEVQLQEGDKIDLIIPMQGG